MWKCFCRKCENFLDIRRKEQRRRRPRLPSGNTVMDTAFPNGSQGRLFYCVPLIGTFVDSTYEFVIDGQLLLFHSVDHNWIVFNTVAVSFFIPAHCARLSVNCSALATEQYIPICKITYHFYDLYPVFSVIRHNGIYSFSPQQKLH